MSTTSKTTAKKLANSVRQAQQETPAVIDKPATAAPIVVDQQTEANQTEPNQTKAIEWDFHTRRVWPD